MPDLITDLDALEGRFAEALTRYGDGNDFSIALFASNPATAPTSACNLKNVHIPHEYLPRSNWITFWGAGTITDHAGDSHAYLVVTAGADRRSSAAREAFVALARAAGALCYRMPPTMAATGTGSDPGLTWLSTLYAYLKGTEFVIEGPGFSRIVCLFAASLRMLALLARGDLEGKCPAYAGSLRPGIPGELGEARFEIVPWEASTAADDPDSGCGQPMSPIAMSQGVLGLLRAYANLAQEVNEQAVVLSTDPAEFDYEDAAEHNWRVARAKAFDAGWDLHRRNDDLWARVVACDPVGGWTKDEWCRLFNDLRSSLTDGLRLTPEQNLEDWQKSYGSAVAGLFSVLHTLERRSARPAVTPAEPSPATTPELCFRILNGSVEVAGLGGQCGTAKMVDGFYYIARLLESQGKPVALRELYAANPSQRAGDGLSDAARSQSRSATKLALVNAEELETTGIGDEPRLSPETIAQVRQEIAGWEAEIVRHRQDEAEALRESNEVDAADSASARQRAEAKLAELKRFLDKDMALGDKSRPMASATERGRTNMHKLLKTAYSKLKGAKLDNYADHLMTSIKQDGSRAFVYQPDTSVGEWHVSRGHPRGDR